MRLVIAEKRSVAFAIAQALGGVRQSDGYVSAGGALISWAQGHLVELSDPEEYANMPWSAHKWTMESLPIDPKSWRWRLSGAKGAAQRYRSLVELLRSDKVTELVNACDPDREGEAIFRRILMAAKVSKPSLRLWVASLDEQAIRDAWNRMRPASDYDGLAVAADARAKADWLVGMNASRAHTLAWHRSLSLGRVRTPTLNMVVQRDLAIEAHKPTPFWRLIVPMDGWTLESGKIEDQVMLEYMLRHTDPGGETAPRACEAADPVRPDRLAEGHERTVRADRRTDVGLSAAFVRDEGRDLSAYRFEIHHP